jgi:predicted type IV restriction endonuclease
VETDSVIVIVAPGAVLVRPDWVTVTAGRVWVVVKVVMEPGRREIMVVPAWVKVVGIPGKLVVTTEVTVDAGRTTVEPG